MKKIIVWFLLFPLLTACAPTATPLSTPTGGATSAPSETATPLPPTDTPTPAPQIFAISPDNLVQIKQTATYALPNAYRVYVSPDSRHALVEAQNQVVRLSLPDLKVENQLTVTEPATLMAVSAARDLAAVRKDETTIEIQSIESGQTVGTLQPQGQFSAAFFTPDGLNLGVTSLDEIRVDLYDLSNQSLLKQFRGFETAAPVFNVFPAGDAKSLAWISRARLQLMDFASGQLGAEVSHEDFIAGWALSPDGARLATSAGGEVDGQFAPLVFLWDARSGQQLATIKLPDSPSPSLAFSPDGRLLAGAVGKTVQLWRTDDRSPLAALTGPTENISYLAFSPDGAYLLASAQDGAVHLWQVVP